MTAPSYCIFDGDGGSGAPALPTDDCENVGGGLLFTNSVKYPPRSHEHPAAEDWHQMEQLIARMSRTGAPITIWGAGSPSTPTIGAVKSWSDNVTAGNCTITRTGTGVYTITVTAAAIWSRPDADMAPKSGGTGTTPVLVTTSQSTNTLTIHMNDTTGAPTDTGSWWVDCFGL